MLLLCGLLFLVKSPDVGNSPLDGAIPNLLGVIICYANFDTSNCVLAYSCLVLFYKTDYKDRYQHHYEAQEIFICSE